MKDYEKEMTIGKAKKILRGFLAKDCYYDTPLYYAIPYLLDYITNLQEENKRLRELDENYPIEEQLEEALKYERIYKTRNEKAIEYIENNEDFETEIFDCNTGGCLGTDLSIQAKTLLNILQGSDK